MIDLGEFHPLLRPFALDLELELKLSKVGSRVRNKKKIFEVTRDQERIRVQELVTKWNKSLPPIGDGESS